MNLGYLLLFLIVFSAFPLQSHEVLIYQVLLTYKNEVTIYNYTFVINSIQNNFVNFTLIITNENNGSVILNNTYVYPLNQVKVLPINGTVFNGINFTFVGYSIYHGENASVYRGIFEINGVKIPSEAYFANGILQYLNGSTNNYSVSVTLTSQYILSSSPQFGGLLIVGIIILMIVVGVVLLIKIGKI